jgi:hypothetical protein
MHRSRFLGIFVDVPAGEADASVGFWSSALGVEPVRHEGDPFVALPGAVPGLLFEVQAVDDAPRYHVDIETDDVAAETARLVDLGAELIDRRPGWNILRAPGGHLLCVVPIQQDREGFERTAREWS